MTRNITNGLYSVLILPSNYTVPNAQFLHIVTKLCELKHYPTKMDVFLKLWFPRKNTSMLLPDHALITAISDVGWMDSIYAVLLSKCRQTAGSASWDTVQSWNRLETLNHRVPWTLLFRDWQSDWLIIMWCPKHTYD